MTTGPLHAPSWRQLISPLPYSPPNTNAAFLSDGTTTTHAALSQRSFGTSRSGAAWISLSTWPASSIRFFAPLESSPASRDVAASTPISIPQIVRMSSILLLRPLLPDPAQLDDDLDRLLHVLHATPTRGASGSCARRRRGSGVGSPMNDRREPSVPPRIGVRRARSSPARRIGLARVLDDVGMPVEHLPHVAVLLLDVDFERARPAWRATTSRASALEPALPSPSGRPCRSRGRSAAPSSDRRRPARRTGCTKPVVALRRLRRQAIARQAVDEVGGDLDRVHHAALRVARDAC